jgi:hypothetical protein
VAPAATALLHLDERKAHDLLDDSSGNDKTDRWCLDTGATHHMIGRWEFFSKLDSGVRGTVKFGDASAVEIKDVGSIVFVAKTGEHRLLTDVYYIPALRNSIISLGQLMRTDRAWRSSTGCCASGIIDTGSWSRSPGATASTSFTHRWRNLFVLQPAVTTTLGGGTSAFGTSTLRP